MKITKFQRIVYDKTMEIPLGRVTSYKEIARAINRPKAFRAVGNALNKNPTPIAVPCHRVVKSDLRIGGFARGSAHKTRLLEEEGVIIEEGLVRGEIFTY
jgi:methylated-DNA-[protein]-cysteine S-methyltransferase